MEFPVLIATEQENSNRPMEIQGKRPERVPVSAPPNGWVRMHWQLLATPGITAVKVQQGDLTVPMTRRTNVKWLSLSWGGTTGNIRSAA
jgi:hypothetical protein